MLPETWHVVITKENLTTLSTWRFDNISNELSDYIGGRVDMTKWNDDGRLVKGHNPKQVVVGNSKTYDEGEEITFEQFKSHVYNEPSIFNEDMSYLKEFLIKLNIK